MMKRSKAEPKMVENKIKSNIIEVMNVWSEADISVLKLSFDRLKSAIKSVKKRKIQLSHKKQFTNLNASMMSLYFIELYIFTYNPTTADGDSLLPFKEKTK